MSFKSFFMNLKNQLTKGWSRLRSWKNSSENLAKKQVLHLTTTRRFPSWKQWKRLPQVLNVTEKKILQGTLSVAVLSFLTLTGWLIINHRTEMPAVGGEYTEGLIGSPQFINPIYASANDVDSDLTRLIYSGLFRWDQNQGLVPDLTESYTISEDQKTYTVKIRDGVKWHNGDPVRSSDVIFTIQSIQNPAYHSPLAVSFRGVTASEVDELTIQFVLEEPFAPFLSSLVVGILPSSLWSEISPKNAPLASLNLSPTGCGPYKFEKYTIEKSGEIKSYTLVRNPNYFNEPAKIEHLTFKFYNDAQSLVSALQNQNIEGASFVPTYLIEEVKKNKSLNILHPSMPQAVALFFNQDTPSLLKDENIKNALVLAINKEEILDDVLNGNGTVIDSPILPDGIGFNPDVSKIEQDTAAALALIDKTSYTQTSPDGFRAKKTTATENGETKDSFEELTITLTTVNQPLFISTAEMIAAQAKLAGIKIQIQTTEPSLLYEEVIKPRAYQILLTATQYGIDPDPYPFWHSSQIKDPGLNLSLYSNRKVDDLLEKARVTNNLDERAAAYKDFQDLIVDDLPAVFLFQPTYTYAISSKIKNVSLQSIKSPTDRFQNITGWYIKTKQEFK